jgi:hypothetical protein
LQILVVAMRSLVLLFACLGCSQFAQHRAALVPHATPVQTTGQGAAWKGTATFGASNIADLAPPTSDSNAGIAIPSKQLRGALGVALTKNLSIGVFHERGLASSAQPVKDSLPPLDDEQVSGAGYSVSYSIPTDSPWRVGLSMEMAVWKTPWVEYSVCLTYCGDDPIVEMTTGHSLVPSIGLGIVPSYQHGDWTFFGGVTGRTHPTIDEKVVNYGEPPEVRGGPFNAIVHGGAAYEAGERVQFVIEMHQTVTTAPAQYAPGIGFSVVLGLGERYPKAAPVSAPARPGA